MSTMTARRPGVTDAPDAARPVIAGVDTHQDVHQAAAVDELGRLLGCRQFPADGAGYAQLLDWLRGLGEVRLIGVEGTGVYGAGLTRFLQSQGVVVIEVDRPDRADRRRRGKSDPVDAEAAARAALSGRASGTPKDRTGIVEAIRVLRVARRSAQLQQRQVCGQMRGLVVTAPEELAVRLRGLTMHRLVVLAAAFRLSGAVADPLTAHKVALRRLARRSLALKQEVAETDRELKTLIGQVAPGLLEVYGVGVDGAGQLLVTAGQNADRLRGEATFARITGTAPLPASSGRTDRHRLNRGGDRQANASLHRMVLSRLAHDPTTQAYVARRVSEGRSKREAIRCLQRYLARQLFRQLQHELVGPPASTGGGSGRAYGPPPPPSRPLRAPSGPASPGLDRGASAGPARSNSGQPPPARR